MKYMGSKNRICKYIVPILQEYIDNNNIKIYVEPFVGGANVIDKINCEIKIGYDINIYLIELLKYVRDNYTKSNCFPEMITKEYYDKVKKSYRNKTDKFSDLEKGIVGFLASYNGKFFDGGYSGLVKIKDGSYRNYYNESKNNILKQAPNLVGIDFQVQNYKDFSKNLKNSLIYCDPPYEKTTSYTHKNINHNDFWEWIREVSLNNYVIISSEEAPNDFITIWEKENIYRSISNNKKGKAFKKEKLFIYKNGLIN